MAHFESSCVCGSGRMLKRSIGRQINVAKMKFFGVFIVLPSQSKPFYTLCVFARGGAATFIVHCVDFNWKNGKRWKYSIKSRQNVDEKKKKIIAHSCITEQTGESNTNNNSDDRILLPLILLPIWFCRGLGARVRIGYLLSMRNRIFRDFTQRARKKENH